MPDTLCRNCGTELKEQSRCSECRKAIQQVCPNCKYATLEQIHTNCVSGFEMVHELASGDQTTMVKTT